MPPSSRAAAAREEAVLGMTAMDISNADFFNYSSTGKKADSQSKAGQKREYVLSHSQGFKNPSKLA